MTSHLKSLFLIASLVFVVYSNALSGQFLWDDEYLILENPWVQDFRHIPELLTHDLHAFATQPAFYYRPIQSLSILLDFRLLEWHLWGFHLTNLFLHAAVSCLVYGLAIQLGFSSLQALLVALLFGLHPTLTGSVSYVSGRADPLVTLWSLLSVSGLLHFLREGKWRGYIASLLCFSLALLSKEIALVLPFIFFLLMRLFAKRKFRETIGPLLGYLASVLFYLLGRFLIFGNLFGRRATLFSLWQLVVFSAKSSLIHLKLLFLPFPLYLERYVEKQGPFWEPPVALGLCFLVVLFALWRKARSARATFGWFWFWIFLFASSPLVLGTNRYADHALYLPLIGISMVVIDGLSVILEKRMRERRWQWIIAFFVAAVFGSLSVKTTLRNKDWRDPETFYGSILKYNPKSTKALLNLAILYDERGDRGKAEAFFKKTIEVSPTFAEAYSDLGKIFAEEGRLEEATQIQQKALSLQPDMAEIHHNLASTYRLRGNCQEAIASYQKALSLKPYFIESHYFLADCYEKLHLLDKAQAEREWLLKQGITVIRVRRAP